MKISLTHNNQTYAQREIPTPVPKRVGDRQLLIDRTSRSAWKSEIVHSVEFNLDSRKIEVVLSDGSARSIELDQTCSDELIKEKNSPLISTKMIDLVSRYVYPQITSSDLPILYHPRTSRSGEEIRDLEERINDHKPVYAGLKIAEVRGTPSESREYWDTEIAPLLEERERLVEEMTAKRSDIAQNYAIDPHEEREKPSNEYLVRKMQDVLKNGETKCRQDPLYPQILEQHELLQ